LKFEILPKEKKKETTLSIFSKQVEHEYCCFFNIKNRGMLPNCQIGGIESILVLRAVGGGRSTAFNSDIDLTVRKGFYTIEHSLVK